MTDLERRAKVHLQDAEAVRESCIICKERVICPIYSCASTCPVLVCGSCQPKLTSQCPHCKSDTLKRNKPVEALIGHKMATCRYSESGCTVQSSMADMGDHLLCCSFR